MRKGLAVKPDKPDICKRCQHVDMGRIHHLRRPIDRNAVPLAQRGAQNGAFLCRIGAIGGIAERGNALPVGFNNGGIDPVKRGAAHRAQRANRA